MTQVIIYSKQGCPYCSRARQLLNNNNISYKEIVLNPDDPNYYEKRNKLFVLANQKTFPIIYNGTNKIGGCSDLEKKLLQKV